MDVENDGISEETIKANLEMFLPYICDCVAAKDLLVHLHYFTREQRKEIFSRSLVRSQEATRSALDIVMHETSDPGRYIAFLEAVRHAGYTKVAKILAGNHIPYDFNCRKIVDLFTHELTGRLKPAELLPLLRKYNVISESDAEAVRTEQMNHSRSRACWLLLYYLPCREKNWFKYFLLTLMSSHQFKDLAEKLDPDLYEKLLIQQEAREDNSLASLQEESLSLIYARSSMFDVRENCLSDHESAPSDNRVDAAPQRGIDIASVSEKNAEVDEDKLEDAKKLCNIKDLLEDFSGLEIKEQNIERSEKQEKDKCVRAENAGNAFSNDTNDLDAADDEETVVEKDTLEETKEFHNDLSPDISPQVVLEEAGSSKKKPTDVKTRIRYTREFLLEFRNSPLSRYTPREVAKFPEIQLNRAPKAFLGRTFNHNDPNDHKHTWTKKDVKTRIRYTREFLLEFRDSPLSQYTPREVANFPEIQLNRAPKAFLWRTFNRNDPNDHKHTWTKKDIQVTDKATTGQKQAGNIQNVAEADETHAKTLDFDNLLPNTDDGTETKRIVNPADETCVKTLDFDSLLPNTDNRTEVKPTVDPDETHVKTLESFNSLLPDADDRTDVKLVANAADDEDEDMSDDFSQLLLDDLKAEKAAEEHKNDLSAETKPLNVEETEFNIKTDEDVLEDTEDNDIQLRNYQRELAQAGCEGENVIVMAPTNSGKTRVSCAIMQAHMRHCKRAGKIGRAVFIVENEALAGQQGKVCEEQLPAYRTKVISGSIQRDKQQYLKDFIDRRDILVVTAQVLVNALLNQEIQSVAAFSMMVFDECHHTNSFHPYNQIMSKYMDLKLNKNNRFPLPQVIGLTASIGVGGHVNPDKAMDHMKQIMSNMDASFLCTVRENVEELQQYENPPKEETVTVAGREHDVFRVMVDNCMDRINTLMATHPSMANLDERDKLIKEAFVVPGCHGTEQFLQWLSKFKKATAELSSDAARRVLNPCRHHLEVYNKALMIHRDARVHEARKVFQVYMQDQIDENTVKDDTDRKLLNIYERVQNINYVTIPENPKLLKLEELILNVLQNDPNARGIIFVKTRELARALIRWTRETTHLAPLNAQEFVGQVASASEGGMTKSNQKDILEYFKGGRHKLVIATSVAEEGLDIAKCNLVIRYEHVTNEIVRLQSRGRARAEFSKYYVLTEAGSWIAAKEEKNVLLEELMKKLVPIVQHEIEANQNSWQREMREMQKEVKEQERLKEEERLEKQAAGPCQIQCLNCSKFICMSTDIRQIQNAHHVVINDEVKTRIVTMRSPFPKFEESELKYDGGIYCLQCAYPLGGVCEYKTVEFPLLKVKQLRVVTRHGVGVTTKKWKDVPFYVEKFTLDDLRLVVERKLEEYENRSD